MSAPAIANPVSRDLTRDRLRNEHKVRIVRSDEEGTAFDKLPAGVYGFTYAPATESPLFAGHSYRRFELHKLPDGTGRLLVYSTPEDASRLNGNEESGEIIAYPDPWEKATTLAAVPLQWIRNSLYKPVRRDGNAIPLQIGPRS